MVKQSLWVAVHVRVRFRGEQGIEAKVAPLLVTDAMSAAQAEADRAYERLRGEKPLAGRARFALTEEIVDGDIVRHAFYVAPAPALEILKPLGDDVAVVFKLELLGPSEQPRLNVEAVVPSVGEYFAPEGKRGYLILPCPRWASRSRPDA